MRLALVSLNGRAGDLVLREGHGSPWSEVHCDPRRLRSLTPGSSDPLEGESFTGIVEQVLSEI